MINQSRRFLAAPMAFFSITLPVLLAAVFLFGSHQSASAQYTDEAIVIRFPYEVTRSGMVVIDLDGDGKQEIIAGSENGHVMVVDGASYQFVWIKNMADYLPGYSQTRVHASLAAADLDNNGSLELVVATGGTDPAIDETGPGAILVFTYRGAPSYFELMPGWPSWALDELGPKKASPDGHPDGFSSSPSLGDVNGDGNMEIVIGGMDRRIHAYQLDGTELPGWPLDRSYDVKRESRSTAALADMDGDGILDIVIGSNNFAIPGCANPYTFYALRADKTPIPGFPFLTTQNIVSSPAIGDINGDGSLDIVFGTGTFDENCGQPSDGKKVYALDRFGQLLPGWPVRTEADTPHSPALGDLDNDGTPEVVFHTDDTLYAWHGDGRLVQGFPVKGTYVPGHIHSTPVLADLDGDGNIEILISTGQIYNGKGELLKQRRKLLNKLFVTDQDGDGLLETIGSNNHYWAENFLHLYIFQETGPASSANPWPTFHVGNDRRGVLMDRYHLSGRITDMQGNAVANATVTASNGRTARTDAQGNYVFANMPPGNHTITPALDNYMFNPAQQKVVFSANSGSRATADFVMRPPAWEIRGRVKQANASPLAGVTLRLDTGATAVTDEQGRFSFGYLPAGQYTIIPVKPDLQYLPKQIVVIAQEDEPLLFYALPKSVTAVLNSNDDTLLVLQDTQGLTTRITFPAGIEGEEVNVTPILPAQPENYLSAGHAIHLSLSGPEGASTSEVRGKDGEPLPLVLTIQYSQTDLRSVLSANELTLFWQSPDGWVEAETTCQEAKAGKHDLASKSVSASVCRWGTYGLFAPVHQNFLPALSSE